LQSLLVRGGLACAPRGSLCLAQEPGVQEEGLGFPKAYLVHDRVAGIEQEVVLHRDHCGGDPEERRTKMLKPWLLGTLGLSLILLAGCSGQTCSAPLNHLVQSDGTLYEAGQLLLNEVAGTFSDLIPQALASQVTASQPLNLKRARRLC